MLLILTAITVASSSYLGSVLYDILLQRADRPVYFRTNTKAFTPTTNNATK